MADRDISPYKILPSKTNRDEYRLGRLKQIYSLIYKQLENLPRFQEEINYYRTVDCRKWNNNDFFQTISEVIFYSNLPRETVNHKLLAIKEAFSDFDIDKVAGYTKKDIQRLKRTPGIIHHEGRLFSYLLNSDLGTGLITVCIFKIHSF